MCAKELYQKEVIEAIIKDFEKVIDDHEIEDVYIAINKLLCNFETGKYNRKFEYV